MSALENAQARDRVDLDVSALLNGLLSQPRDNVAAPVRTGGTVEDRGVRSITGPSNAAVALSSAAAAVAANMFPLSASKTLSPGLGAGALSTPAHTPCDPNTIFLHTDRSNQAAMNTNRERSRIAFPIIWPSQSSHEQVSGNLSFDSLWQAQEGKDMDGLTGQNFELCICNTGQRHL